MTDISPSPPPATGALAPYPSLAALRSAHGGLLQHRRLAGDTSEFLAEVRAFIGWGQTAGALLDINEDRWAAQSLLDFWANVLVRAGLEPPDATLADFDPTLAPELDDALCPYVGLDPFREAAHDRFFGRQRLIDELVARLAQNHLLAVVGPSGSGKSSLVLAGLLPALKAGALPGSRNWHYLPPMTPGSNPLANLVRAVCSERGPAYLAQLPGEPANVPAVLVVDQFEEVFTLCRDDQARQAFVDNLLALADAPGTRHTVILTMRSDFESFVTRIPTLEARFEQARVLLRVTPLNAGELREAIEKPAALVGLKFEEGIVDALSQDILGEPAALPLLQFTLLKLWESRERNRVTWDAYRKLGNARQALARSADAFYTGLIPEEQVTARRILLRMVRPGEGLEVTSNRVRRATLYQAGEARYRVDAVLDKLVAARLVRLTEGETPADAQVEVAHEALVRNWPRLVEWLEDERAAIRQRLRLTAAAEQWEALGRDPGALLRGALLEEAQRYEDLNEQEAAFVRASQAAAEEAERQKEAARQRELEQARALAEEQARAARRLGRLALALAAVLVLAVAAAVFAMMQRQQAQTSERLAAINAAEAMDAQATAVMESYARATEVAIRSTAESSAREAQATAVKALQEVQVALKTREAQVMQQLAAPTPTAAGPWPANTPLPTKTSIGTPSSPTRQPTPTTTPPVTSTPTPNQAATATVLALERQLNEIRATQTAIAEQLGIYAVIPDISIYVRSQPSYGAAGLELVRAPAKLRVIRTNDDLWVEVESPSGIVGWIDSKLVTFEGDAKVLPPELRYRVTSSRNDLPFIDGRVVSYGGAQGDYLLRDPNNEMSGFLWVPVGTEVTVLNKAGGSHSYGSGLWYLVFLVDPNGQNKVYIGWLPMEVIEKR